MITNKKIHLTALLLAAAGCGAQPSAIDLNPSGTSTVYSVFLTDAWTGTNTSSLHTGDDTWAQDWTENSGRTRGQRVYAAISGTIAANYQSSTSYGNTVVLYDGASRFGWRYAHLEVRSPVLSDILYAPAGVTFIGRVGNSGSGSPPSNTTFNPHLHAVLYKDLRDPGGRPFTRVDLQSQTDYSVNPPAVYAAPYAFTTCPATTSAANWHPDGTLLMDASGTVWLVEAGKRRGIPTWDTFIANGFNRCLIIRATQPEMNCTPQGANVTSPPARSLLKAGNGAIYLVTDRNFKRVFASALAFQGLGYAWDEAAIANAGELEGIPDDPSFPVLYAPFAEGDLIQKSGDATVYVISNGRKRAVASAQAFTNLGYQFDRVIVITSALFDSIPASPEAPISETLTGSCAASPGAVGSPNLSIGASTAGGNVTAGQAVSFTVAVQNSGAILNDALLDIEVFDAGNHQVFQQPAWTQQSFASGTTRTFAFSWTPSGTGDFRIKAGIFSNDWRTLYYWQDNALTFTVGSGGAPPPGAYTLSIWWPDNNVTLSGTQPFKMRLESVALTDYDGFWSVDGGAPTRMYDSNDGGYHKEAIVDLSGWTWRGSGPYGPYSITLTARHADGTVLASRTVTIYVAR